MNIEFINKKVKGKDIKIGDAFTVEGIVDVFICLAEDNFLEWVEEDGLISEYLHYSCEKNDNSEFFLAFSVKDNCLYIFYEEEEYILVKANVQVEKY